MFHGFCGRRVCCFASPFCRRDLRVGRMMIRKAAGAEASSFAEKCFLDSVEVGGVHFWTPPVLLRHFCVMVPCGWVRGWGGRRLRRSFRRAARQSLSHILRPHWRPIPMFRLVVSTRWGRVCIVKCSPLARYWPGRVILRACRAFLRHFCDVNTSRWGGVGGVASAFWLLLVLLVSFVLSVCELMWSLPMCCDSCRRRAPST